MLSFELRMYFNATFEWIPRLGTPSFYTPRNHHVKWIVLRQWRRCVKNMQVKLYLRLFFHNRVTPICLKQEHAFNICWDQLDEVEDNLKYLIIYDDGSITSLSSEKDILCIRELKQVKNSEYIKPQLCWLIDRTVHLSVKNVICR